MKKFLKWAAAIAAIFLIMQFFGPEKTTLKSYLFMHSEAKLSADDIKALAEWTKAERRRLAETPNSSNEHE